MRILSSGVVTKMPELRQSSKSGKRYVTLLMRDAGSLVCVNASDPKICMALLELSKGDALVISGNGNPLSRFRVIRMAV